MSSVQHGTAQSSGRAALTLGALGVVFGDIGTSPLYTIQTVFNPGDPHPVAASMGSVYGVVSLIFWSVTIIVTLKHVLLVLRADNDGEGGILALITLIRRHDVGRGARPTGAHQPGVSRHRGRPGARVTYLTGETGRRDQRQAWIATLPGARASVRRRPFMILPKVRDPRLVTIRRGGTLTDSNHHLLALWAASCAEHVLDLFETAQPADARPRQAIEQVRAWVCGDVTMTEARAAGGHAMGAARDLRGAARHAAYAAGQAGAVAHVAAHDLGAAAYAIKAVRAAASDGLSEVAGRRECRWQHDQLPEAIRDLVLDDQRVRNEICWSVFDC